MGKRLKFFSVLAGNLTGGRGGGGGGGGAIKDISRAMCELQGQLSFEQRDNMSRLEKHLYEEVGDASRILTSKRCHGLNCVPSKRYVEILTPPPTQYLRM